MSFVSIMTHLADFSLGLFVGVYALASFSPEPFARQVYRLCWFFAGGFVLLAWLQTLAGGPSARSLLSQGDQPSVFMGLSTLEWALIFGVAVAFIGGKIGLRKLSLLQTS